MWDDLARSPPPSRVGGPPVDVSKVQGCANRRYGFELTAQNCEKPKDPLLCTWFKDSVMPQLNLDKVELCSPAAIQNYYEKNPEIIPEDRYDPLELSLDLILHSKIVLMPLLDNRYYIKGSSSPPPAS